MGRIEAIYLKRVRRGPMDPVPEAELVAERGIVGNANQGGRRQVTVLAHEMWAAVMAELSGSLPPSARRANLVVSGLDLERTRGRWLRVGGARLLIMGETKPCERMDEALPGLRAALQEDWRGGVFAAVVEDGIIRVGDAAVLEPAEPAGSGAGSGAPGVLAGPGADHARGVRRCVAAPARSRGHGRHGRGACRGRGGDGRGGR